jgi:hypothetical protein
VILIPGAIRSRGLAFAPVEAELIIGRLHSEACQVALLYHVAGAATIDGRNRRKAGEMNDRRGGWNLGGLRGKLGAY